MQLLSADISSADIDVLAIQEPARNPAMFATYCDPKGHFRPVYPSSHHSRACFLVNKRLPIADWRAEFLGPDITVLTLTTANRTITITNIYAQPTSPTATNTNSPIYSLPEILERKSDHILIGDFNLHHQLWSGSRSTRPDRMALDLLSFTQQAELVLATPPGLVTWRRSESSTSCSTIDLIFLSDGLAQHLVRCDTEELLHHGSDHRPVLTLLSLPADGPCRTHLPSRNWKLINMEAVEAGSSLLQVPPSFISRDQIDNFVEYLQSFIVKLIDDTTPSVIPVQERPLVQCSWWTSEINQLIVEERQARRRGDPNDTLKDISRRKKKAIKKAKRADWRQAVHNAKDSKRGIWGLARWGKERSHLPPELPMVPPLVRGEGLPGKAIDFQEKANMLYAQFFPSASEADLQDITSLSLPEEIEPAPMITEDMIGSALYRAAPFKAAGPDGIPTGFLRAMGKPMLLALQALTQACWDWEYMPKAFRTARTIATRKPGKKDYTIAKAWRPIALLNTLGKVIETVTAQYLQQLAETHSLLPNAQMGARKNRSTETALDLLLSQIRTTWKAGGVATLLSMDISGAYDNVAKDRLIAALRQKGIPRPILGWVNSFMSDRSTTIVFDGKETDCLQIAAGIPQGSPVSPILFLFYSAELFEICNPPDLPIHGIGFMDDANLLAWGHSTEINCANLALLHERCLKWAQRFGVKFEPSKYELMHFTRQPAKFNIRCCIRLGDIVKEPSQEVRILGLFLDPKLRWGVHKATIWSRMTTQINALSRLTGSTWGLPLIQARQVYISMIRPALTYAALAWHQPEAKKGQQSSLTRKFQAIQNKCLRFITGGYKASSISSLETLAFIPPLDLYLTSRVAAYRERLYRSGIGEIISSACARIKRFFNKDSLDISPRMIGHPWPAPKGWARAWRGYTGNSSEPQTKPSYIFINKWKDRWDTQSRGRSEALASPPNKKALLLHLGLHKAESAIFVQLYTGKIGLKGFLYNAKVPGIDNPTCECGYAREEPRHVTKYCPTRANIGLGRDILKHRNQIDFNYLLTTGLGVKVLTRWWLRSGILKQFQLANELIM
jgi:Reverse transcriptase (RNA-dependent DNA polymerase)/Endonuclease-reverse transcriptase